MTSRRHALLTALALPLGAALSGPIANALFGAQDSARAAPATAAGGLGGTDVIYLSPIRRDGRESRCQAEVWFTHDARRIWVVTANTAWRARAIAKGPGRARIWVGDVGPWKNANGRYRALPNAYANASRVTDAKEIEQVLERFGSKYRGEWLLWGPRFRNGMADGSRVMLRYDLA